MTTTSSSPQKIAWALTEGHAGMQNQCIGLAEALGLAYEIKQVKPKAPWKILPARFWPQPLTMTAPGTSLAAPWPDVVISCGRRSVATALAIKRASNGKTFAIHIQDPHVPADLFDVLIVPEHDALRGGNVIVVQGAMHRVTKEKLAAAAEQFRPALASLPHPLIAVLVGGSNRRQDVTPDLIHDLTVKLAQAARESGGALAVTPSRRTGAENERILREGLANVPSYIWDGTGDNPYFGLLALADAIVATDDSVSMVTEACSTGKPVYVYEIPGASKRLQQFQSRLIETGSTRKFDGKIEQWPAQAINETLRVAALVGPMLAAKGKK